MKWSGIEGNLPPWVSASKVYSKAYRYMETYGPDVVLIDCLNDGDEEKIKYRMLYILGLLMEGEEEYRNQIEFDYAEHTQI